LPPYHSSVHSPCHLAFPIFRILKTFGKIHECVESAYSSMPVETILGRMRARHLILPLLGCWLCAAVARVPAGDIPLPMPRVWNDTGEKRFSQAEFEELLRQLKTERAALESEWKALLKRSADAAPKGDSDTLFQIQMKDLLKHLQENNHHPSAAPAERQSEVIKVEPSAPKAKKEEEAPWPESGTGPMPQTVGPLDTLSQAHTLFRSGQYEEALASFRLVDLKGRKAEARAPIQYLMALCLMHLGKGSEAVPLLREVANSRGDEKVAACAQWQLDMIRWDREIHDALQGLKQRRLALEK
jgi:hypothetical protein